jgi:kinesin family protein C1
MSAPSASSDASAPADPPFKTRIPLPTRKPREALAAATANVEVTTSSARASAADVKSAVRGSLRASTNKRNKENAERSSDDPERSAPAAALASKRPARAPQQHHRALAPTQMTQIAPTPHHHPSSAAGSEPSAVEPGASSFDVAEYEAVMALKLASKDTKYDLKAQVTAAKAFASRSKALLRDMRAVAENADRAIAETKHAAVVEMERCVQAAEEASKERDDAEAALDAARAESLSAATHLAAAAKRDQETKRELERLERDLAEALKHVEALQTRSDDLQTQLGERSEALAQERALREAAREREDAAEANRADAVGKLAALQGEKAAMHEELGALKGHGAAQDAQLEALRALVAEHEREKTLKTDELNALHAEAARRTAEKEGAEEQLARAREEAAEARARASTLAVELAELRAIRARLEDEKEALSGEVARVRQDLESAELRAREAEEESVAARRDLAETISRAESLERDRAASQNAHEKELAALRSELGAAKAHRAALEPRVEALGAELAEAKAEARVARAESDHLRRDGEDSKKRGDAAETERKEAALKAEEARMTALSATREAEREKAERTKLEAELEAARSRLKSAEGELDGVRAEKLDAEARAAERDGLASRLDALRAAHEKQSEALAETRRKLADACAADAAAKTRVETASRDAETEKGKTARLEAALARREAELRQAAIVRRALHNEVQELKGNIRVFCRIRPSSSSSGPGDSSPLLGGGKDGDQPLLHCAETGERAGRALRVAPPGNAKTFDFNFDRVFAGGAGQAEVFEEIAHLVQSALDGYKVCIFTYGQTGSGKTYTMLGGEDRGKDGGDEAFDGDASDVGSDASKNVVAPSAGLIPRSIHQIFAARDAALEAAAESRDGAKPPSLVVEATMVEIYNEEIKDLLGSEKKSGGSGSGADAPQQQHAVKHCPKTGRTTVTGLRSVVVEAPSEVDALMRRAQSARTTASTAMNDRSSRSHMVFTLALSGVDASGRAFEGALNLVDLAGSERLSRTGATGERLKEAQSINKSLSALGDVVFALAEKKDARAHVPYRNSKLTYLLQNSLGGDAKTLMFVNVAPGAESAQETLCSLRFAAKVNGVSQREGGEQGSHRGGQ